MRFGINLVVELFNAGTLPCAAFTVKNYFLIFVDI